MCCRRIMMYWSTSCGAIFTSERFASIETLLSRLRKRRAAALLDSPDGPQRHEDQGGKGDEQRGRRRDRGIQLGLHGLEHAHRQRARSNAGKEACDHDVIKG